MVVVTTSANGIGLGYRPGGDQTGDVGHVDKQQRADLVGDGAETGEIQVARIGGETGDDHLRLVLDGQAFDFVVVDQAGFVDAVLHGVVQILPEDDTLAPWVRWPPWARLMPRMVSPALISARYTARCWRTSRVRLHVGVVGTEQLLGALDGRGLDLVDMFAAAVVTLARIAFGVLVGQARCLGLA